MSHLPLDPVGDIFDVRIKCDRNGIAFYAFRIRDNNSEKNECKCAPAQWAFLLTVKELGASIFIDHTDGDAHLKLCGQMERSAGILAGRIFIGLEEGERINYLNGDQLDFRYGNLVFGKAGRAKRGRADIYEVLLSRSIRTGDGTPEENFNRGKQLLNRALDCLDQERDAAQL